MLLNDQNLDKLRVGGSSTWSGPFLVLLQTTPSMQAHECQGQRHAFSSSGALSLMHQEIELSQFRGLVLAQQVSRSKSDVGKVYARISVYGRSPIFLASSQCDSADPIGCSSTN